MIEIYKAIVIDALIKSKKPEAHNKIRGQLLKIKIKRFIKRRK